MKVDLAALGGALRARACGALSRARAARLRRALTRRRGCAADALGGSSSLRGGALKAKQDAPPAAGRRAPAAERAEAHRVKGNEWFALRAYAEARTQRETRLFARPKP
jgi:hypothetical protein